MHLVGKSPAPDPAAAWRNYDEEQMKALKVSLARAAVAEGRSPSEAWDRVMKDVEKSPADDGGIKSGDLIIAIDGYDVAGVDDLLRLLNHERVGHETRVTVLRRGELRERFIVPVERR